MEANLFAISPLDGRYASTIEELRSTVSEFGLIRFRVLVELEWVKALLDSSEVMSEFLLALEASQSELSRAEVLNLQSIVGAQKDLIRGKLNHIIDNFSPSHAAEIKGIEKQTNHDVKSVEYFLRKIFLADPVLKGLSELIHFCCTSEDINNLSYALMVKTARSEVLLPQMDGLLAFLKKFALAHLGQPMLSRTHGQPASPTTVGKEIANVLYRLQYARDCFAQVTILGKINGAVGCFNAHQVVLPNVDWPKLSEKFIGGLGLSYNPFTTQIEPHDYLAEYSHALVRFNTILLDLARDCWGYISLGYFRQKVLATEVGSSTMPHKVNPIDFENAEGNLGIANCLLEHLAAKLPVSRWQRDLTDSTVLRNIGTALGFSLLAYKSCLRGLNKLDVDVTVIESDLEQNVEVLGEAIQTVMRWYHVPRGYELLKELTRGKKITLSDLHELIGSLQIDPTAKERLLSLKPRDYIGLADKLVVDELGLRGKN